MCITHTSVGFPVAETIDDLLPQIEHHLKRNRSRYGNPSTVHTAAWAFEREPRSYTWNSAFSGRPAPALPIWDAKQLPVQCPYVGKRARLLDELHEGQ
jgi:hypothetical protein